MGLITRVQPREILDSRGNPTIEVDVFLSDGAWGRAAVPSGASTGSSEALELRDGDADRFDGRGVLAAVHNVDALIAPEIVGRSATDQKEVDDALCQLDDTPNKSRLGANAVLGVSLAVAQAAARSKGKPLYAYLGGGAPTLPVPMLNIINGGRHAEDSTGIQEFMVVPAGFDTFGRALQAGVEVYHSLRRLLSARKLGTTVGDEGGFAPQLSSNEQAIELVLEAIEAAQYEPGTQCFVALDVAASELASDDGGYRLEREGVDLTAHELAARYERWVRSYPIVSIEDGMGEEDWDGWVAMTAELGQRIQLVGDDVFVTNPSRIKEGIRRRAANALLVKLNQIGTVTEALEAMSTARAAGWGTVISHRSGETEDTAIADLAVGTAAGQIKSGAPARGERTAKYNRLLRIEEELGDRAVYAGRQVYEGFLRGR